MKALVPSFLLILALLACAPAADAEGDFSDCEAVSQWITYYYVKPEPHRVAKALLAASSHGLLKDGQRTAPFFGFLAGVMSKNPGMVNTLAQQLTSLPEVDQPVLILGIWYSGYPDAKPLLKQLSNSMPKHKGEIDYLLAHGRPALLEIQFEQGAWVLDMLWGNFMATGDEAPVARIISALPWANVRDDPSRTLVGGAARWSLISNAIQHKRVMDISRKELTSQPKEVADVLREVIAEAEKDMQEGKTR